MTKDEALRLALEALENGKRVRNADGGTKYQPDLEDKAITAIKAALEAKDEPVAVWELFEDGWDSIAAPYWMELLPVGTKLYTAPPQRTWVGLTDEEMDNFVKAAWGQGVTAADFIRAIEAKLKEKNT